MAISYNKLWKLLIDKKVGKTQLMNMIGCSPNTIAAMSKDEYVSLKTLDRICDVLDCRIEDVVEHIKENRAGEE